MLDSLNDIVTFSVSDSDIQLAKSLRRQRDQIYGNIYEERPTDLRWVGEIGEIVVHRALMMMDMNETTWFTKEAAGKSDFEFRGDSIDVKTVKRKVPMQMHYEAQITRSHTKTPCDTLLFTCYEYPRQLLHVLGTMSKDEFLDTAKLYRAGDSVHKHYTIREGHEILSVYVKQMTPFRDYLKRSRQSYRQVAA